MNKRVLLLLGTIILSSCAHVGLYEYIDQKLESKAVEKSILDLIFNGNEQLLVKIQTKKVALSVSGNDKEGVVKSQMIEIFAKSNIHFCQSESADYILNARVDTMGVIQDDISFQPLFSTARRIAESTIAYYLYSVDNKSIIISGSVSAHTTWMETYVFGILGPIRDYNFNSSYSELGVVANSRYRASVSAEQPISSTQRKGKLSAESDNREQNYIEESSEETNAQGRAFDFYLQNGDKITGAVVRNDIASNNFIVKETSGGEVTIYRNRIGSTNCFSNIDYQKSLTILLKNGRDINGIIVKNEFDSDKIILRSVIDNKERDILRKDILSVKD